MLYPKAVLKTALSEDPALHQCVWKALLSINAETLMREGRIYGGGLHKLEPKELANVPAGNVLKPFPNRRRLEVHKQLGLFAP
jgi:hypothetical protein